MKETSLASFNMYQSLHLNTVPVNVCKHEDFIMFLEYKTWIAFTSVFFSVRKEA